MLNGSMRRKNGTIVVKVDGSAVFVSWKDGKMLRGCLGTFEPGPIDKVLSNASRDSRFKPIKSSEVCRLDVGVSLLSNFEVAAHLEDWIIGRHGIILEFSDERNNYKATYLPEVAVEQGWSREETIGSLINKAGYNGDKKLTQLGEHVKITRYTSKRTTLSYLQYRDMSK